MTKCPHCKHEVIIPTKVRLNAMRVGYESFKLSCDNPSCHKVFRLYAKRSLDFTVDENSILPRQNESQFYRGER
jgi:hypothetical protein